MQNGKTSPDSAQEIGKIEDVSEVVLAAPRTVRKWFADGTLPAEARIKIGKRAVRYRLEVIREWLASK